MKYVGITILIILLIYILSKTEIMETNKMPVDEQEYFNKLVSFIQKKEGGLSKDPVDTASKYPSPTPEKYHTNKGITYRTFVDSASLGYQPTTQNFLNMPNDIWLNIFINKYYNRAKNFSNNIILNGYISTWFWGGWATSLVTPKEVADVLVSKVSNKEKLKKLVDLRKKYFELKDKKK